MSGIDRIRLLKERQPALRLVALTVYDDDDRILQALCAGASGYLLKEHAPRAAPGMPPRRHGRRRADLASGRARHRALQGIPPSEKADYHLTPHEMRLLKLLGDGHSYKTAAAELGSSLNTVGFHMRSIYTKLQVHSKSEAVAKAFRRRLFR